MKNFTLKAALAALVVIGSVAQLSAQEFGQIRFNGNYEGYPPRKTDKTKVIAVDCGTQNMSSSFSHTGFTNGFAFFKQPSNNFWGIIDTLGNVVMKPCEMVARNSYFPYIADGQMLVKAAKAGYELVDLTGKVVAARPNIVKFDCFVDGYATAVFTDSKGGRKIGMIDPKGNIVFAALAQIPKNVWPQRELMRPFENNLSAIKNIHTDLWGFFNRQGKLVIPYQYAEVDDFGDGLAAVKLNDKWGYIDTTGNVAIDFKFSTRPGRFNHKRALVRRLSDDATCVINPAGEILKTYASDGAAITDFCDNGLAVVLLGDACFLVDADFRISASLGRVPIAGYTSDEDRRYEPAVGGGALLHAQGWRNDFYIDSNYRTVVVCRSIGDFRNGLAKVQFTEPTTNKTLFGYINKKGELVILFSQNEF